MKEYVELSKARADLETELEALRKRSEEIEPVLLEQMSADGMQRVNAHGRTVYVHRQLWAKARGDKSAVVEALRGCGLPQYVTPESFNTNSLSAYVREIEQGEGELPTALKDVLELTEKYSLRVRAS
jgi:hypothetical protein